MKFLIDAQLPRRLCKLLARNGYDALHTLDLERGNSTPDSELNDLSLHDRRVLVTKDADFVDSIILQNKPHKLLLISTGNIRNDRLELLIESNLEEIVLALDESRFVELSPVALHIHF